MRSRTSGNPSQRIGVNSVLLHRGHLPAVSNKTGFVKRFTYRQSLHTHRIDRFSCGRSIRSNAFDAISRIASRAAFSGLSVESITSILAVEVCQQICAICAPKDEVKAFSCSYERIIHSTALSRTKTGYGCALPHARSIALPKCRLIRHNYRHAAFQSLSPSRRLFRRSSL